MFDEVLSKLSSERDRENFKWLYESTRNGDVSTLIHGMMMHVVVNKPEATYFEIVQAVRDQLTVIKI